MEKQVILNDDSTAAMGETYHFLFDAVRKKTRTA